VVWILAGLSGFFVVPSVTSLFGCGSWSDNEGKSRACSFVSMRAPASSLKRAL